MNRDKNQNKPKLPQSGGGLGSFWFSTRPTTIGGTDYNLHHGLKSSVFFFRDKKIFTHDKSVKIYPLHPWHVGENITRDTRDKLIWNLPYFLLFFQARAKFRTRDTPKPTRDTTKKSHPWHPWQNVQTWLSRVTFRVTGKKKHCPADYSGVISL